MVGVVLILALASFVVIFLGYAYMNQPLVKITNIGKDTLNTLPANNPIRVNGTKALDNNLNVWNYWPLWAGMAVLIWAVARALKRETAETAFEV